MGHERFVNQFIHCLKIWLSCEVENPYASVGLRCMALFIASFNNSLEAPEDDNSTEEETHPLIQTTFLFLLQTYSDKVCVRFRLCQFVNMLLDSLGSDAALDDEICDSINEYMTYRMQDKAPHVRVQAVLATHRLQNPDDTKDDIIVLYLKHLREDPSAKVRQAIITYIAKTNRILPFIIERLSDVDETVRRHCYIQMSSFPVQSYTIEQRITFLEAGLNDHSDSIRKVGSTN